MNASWQRRLYMYSSQNKILEEKLQMLDKINLPGVNVNCNEVSSQKANSPIYSVHEKELEDCFRQNLKQPLKCNSQVRNFLRLVKQTSVHGNS